MKIIFTYTAYLIIAIILFACSTQTDPLPQEFYGLKIAKKLIGKDTKDYVDRLHFNEVAPDENEIGFYSGDLGTAVIYITYYNNSESALREYLKMTKNISPNNSPFVRSEFIILNNNRVYRTYGMGQVHFVFVKADMLIWLSEDPAIGSKFVEEYLKYLK